MSINKFERLNKINGFIIFLVALTTYYLTVEPTASYWDCRIHFNLCKITSRTPCQELHFFQMMGAFFASFASDLEEIAFMVNMMSVFASAITIFLLFLTTSIIGKKVLKISEKVSKTDAIKILGASSLASLTFTFSDSFWFNAVEAEVYAMATCIMALLFWLGFKWEQDMDNERGDKWLILISLVIGLSFGVHFMGLLVIPAIGMIYFFKKYPNPNFKNFILANIFSVAILLFIFKLLLPSTLGLLDILKLTL